MRSKVKFGILMVAVGILAMACSGAKKEKASETEEVAAVVYTCPMHPEVTSNEPGDCPECNMKLVEKTEGMDHESMHMTDSIYTCPMHAEVLKHEMGTCPECGMDLVLKEAETEHSHEGHNHD